MKERLIKNFMEKQEVIVKEEDKIIAIGKKVNEYEYLLYEFATNRFYMNSDGEEYYVDDLLQIIFEGLE